MSDIRVEIFLEYGCRSNAPLIDALQTASAHVSLTITVFIRGKDSAEFLRRGIVISPATFIDGRLAFYGPVTANEILRFINEQFPQRPPEGAL